MWLADTCRAAIEMALAPGPILGCLPSTTCLVSRAAAGTRVEVRRPQIFRRGLPLVPPYLARPKDSTARSCAAHGTRGTPCHPSVPTSYPAIDTSWIPSLAPRCLGQVATGAILGIEEGLDALNIALNGNLLRSLPSLRCHAHLLCPVLHPSFVTFAYHCRPCPRLSQLWHLGPHDGAGMIFYSHVF